MQTKWENICQSVEHNAWRLVNAWEMVAVIIKQYAFKEKQIFHSIEASLTLF